MVHIAKSGCTLVRKKPLIFCIILFFGMAISGTILAQQNSELIPPKLDSLFAEARKASDAKDWHEAISTWENIGREFPDNDLMLMPAIYSSASQRAFIYGMNLGDFEKAIVVIKWIGTHADYDRIDVRRVQRGD